MVQVGDAAPDLALPSQSGEQVRLSEIWRQRVVVLYFYPKDDTRGCTREACAFRDSYEIFRDAGAEVVGVSGDPVDSHEAFAGRYELPFTLLSDVDGTARRQYGVKRTLGIPGRVTYVIDTGGTVRHVFSSMTNIGRHIDDALAMVRELQTA